MNLSQVVDEAISRYWKVLNAGLPTSVALTTVVRRTLKEIPSINSTGSVSDEIARYLTRFGDCVTYLTGAALGAAAMVVLFDGIDKLLNNGKFYPSELTILGGFVASNLMSVINESRLMYYENGRQHKQADMEL